MPNPAQTLIPFAAAALAAWALAGPASAAEPVYRCVKDGKPSYTANPSAKDGQCQETAIRDDGPKPEELARLLEEKKRRQEEEAKAREAEQKERELRAKELEAAAAARQARALEEQLLLQRQQQQEPAPYIYNYPPYWVGGIVSPRPPLVRPLPPAPQPLPQPSAPPMGFRR
jgi:hypothetical protein